MSVWTQTRKHQRKGKRKTRVVTIIINCVDIYITWEGQHKNVQGLMSKQIRISGIEAHVSVLWEGMRIRESEGGKTN